MDFLTQNAGTIIVAAVLIAVLAVVVICIVRNKKNGVSSCGGGCSGCPFSGRCGGKDGGTSAEK